MWAILSVAWKSIITNKILPTIPWSIQDLSPNIAYNYLVTFLAFLPQLCNQGTPPVGSKKHQPHQKCYKPSERRYSLVPRRGGEGRKSAWYTLFAHAGLLGWKLGWQPPTNCTLANSHLMVWPQFLSIGHTKGVLVNRETKRNGSYTQIYYFRASSSQHAYFLLCRMALSRSGQC